MGHINTLYVKGTIEFLRPRPPWHLDKGVSISCHQHPQISKKRCNDFMYLSNEGRMKIWIRYLSFSDLLLRRLSY